MARRSSSSRWSRPATGKQIAALKAVGKYDGKYYSMGRASQAIGGSAGSSPGGSRLSGGGPSRGSVYSPLATSGFGPSGLLSRLLVGTADLGSLLQPALGLGPQSRLASSEAGPTGILSELLGVPDDLDSLVQVALGEAGSVESMRASEDGPVESVAYTVRSDESDPAQPRIVVEAEVVRNSDFNGRAALQVRFVGAGEASGGQASDRVLQPRARSALAYRPTWTPVLVRTPAELAEQMRVHWGAAAEELDEGVDPRLTTFLKGAGGMEAALAVLNSGQSSASKFVHLQGLLDPGGPIQFQGLDLNAATFAEQIRIALEGDENALDWLEAVQREQVLTSFAEITGTSLAAEADFRLARWRRHAVGLIDAVTMDADDAGFDFATIRALLMLRAENEARLEELRAKRLKSIEAHPESAAHHKAALDRIDALRPDDSSSEYGLLEDWFFEETRIYLLARLRQSLPGHFAAALNPHSSDLRRHDPLADEVHRLIDESSTDLNDYSADTRLRTDSGFGWYSGAYSGSSRSVRSVDRRERIVQAVRRAIADSEAAGDDDLGTLIIAREVLGYAQWKRDELRGAKQVEELDRRRAAAAQRSDDARTRVEAAEQRGDESLRNADAISGLERDVQKYTDALARTANAISIDETIQVAAQEAASARISAAKEREVAAGERRGAAEERQRWANSEISVAATPEVSRQLHEERDAALAEISAARAERQAALHEQQVAQDQLTQISAARTKYEVQILPVREENRRRLQAEDERRREVLAKQEEERRLRAEEQRKKQAAERERRDAADRLQEQRNQAQQDRARTAKNALVPEVEQLLSLPATASFWRRKTLEATRRSLEESVLKLQREIAAPLVPPRTSSKTWPSMLSPTERYLGTVKKLADYGAFISLPAGADGLLRGSDGGSSLAPGQLVIVEIVDMPYGKPVVLRRISR